MDTQEITVDQAALAIGVTRQTVYNKQKRGELPERLTVPALRAYVQTQRAQLDAIDHRLDLLVAQMESL